MSRQPKGKQFAENTITNRELNNQPGESFDFSQMTEVTVPDPALSGNPNAAARISDVTGLDHKQSVRVATVQSLPDAPIYDNGSNGQGATLTASTNAELNAVGIDGIADLSPNQRVLVKDQADQEQNGVYFVSEPGVAGSIPWVLERASDADAGNEFNGGATLEVEEGNDNARTRWSLAKHSGWTDGVPAGSEPAIGDPAGGLLVFFQTPSFNLSDVGVPTPLNKDETPIPTSGDNSPTNIRLATQPFIPNPGNPTHIQVEVNGIGYVLGDGTDAGVDCYFSVDGGLTPAPLNALVGGDLNPANNHELIWNGVYAGFELDNTDRIDLHYPSAGQVS
jgi:hypothetical protein